MFTSSEEFLADSPLARRYQRTPFNVIISDFLALKRRNDFSQAILDLAEYLADLRVVLVERDENQQVAEIDTALEIKICNTFAEGIYHRDSFDKQLGKPRIDVRTPVGKKLQILVSPYLVNYSKRHPYK